ncbi:hypothetical protein NW757_005389 [Fusarium falciforme]|nr:hypothetical protein NW757_005389 [Fusarium falciforme]
MMRTATPARSPPPATPLALLRFLLTPLSLFPVTPETPETPSKPEQPAKPGYETPSKPGYETPAKPEHEEPSKPVCPGGENCPEEPSKGQPSATLPYSQPTETGEAPITPVTAGAGRAGVSMAVAAIGVFAVLL